MQDFLARVQRRTGHVLRELLPRNEQYRPTGIHASSQALAAKPGSGATYSEVYPAYVSHLSIPAEFNTLRPAYYDPIAAREDVPAAFVLTLPAGRLNVDNRSSVAIIAQDNHLVGDASLQYAAGSFAMAAAAHNPVLRQRYFQHPVQINGTVCSLLSGGGAAIGNYYHWLLDSLPRLHLVQEAGLWDSIDYFLIYDRRHRFAVESLLELGIRDEQIIDVQQNAHLCADQLVVTSPVRGGGLHAPEWVGEFMQQTYLPNVAPAGRPARPFSPFVYVSRRDAAFRRVRNEAEVEAVLAEYGFVSYALSELSLREKAALFAGARVVVGPVGAGLVNILFCAPGTALVEFLPRNLVVGDYLDLTSRLHMSHYPLIGRRDEASAQKATADRQDDLTVDLAALRQALRLALPQPERQPAALA
ncbi:glycosyltransferase family 61 protein [Hymenobacter persicinus]|uniref:Glycosyltransferase family 61 protein n=1 Tax=Hymenobacter persicinus TaxID=2025506 RepID=A0A4Q5L6C6_9BACT|nr:glycosyltransferase family 61 protein [Hymenobacter persicinus]RYU74630.1 glycosyltransferase family 61 protein [Hymenobacter persicinus]